MKRCEAVNAILKVLKTYEDCKMTRKAATEILDVLENDLGIITPDEIITGMYTTESGDRLPIYGCEWEKVK